MYLRKHDLLQMDDDWLKRLPAELLLEAVFVKIVVALGDQAACILSERCKLSETMTSRSGLRVTVSR